MTEPIRKPYPVALVGAGPGDPGLLTLRGAERLKLAEVVLYDHLASHRLLDLVPTTAERIFAGKTVGKCALPQDAINALLVEKARQGLRVVRLKGGDPYVFGRGAEEAEYLKAHGIAVEVIPGVTAGVGVTSYAGIAVTHRDVASAVAFVTGHDDPEAPPGRSKLDWHALACFPGTLVIYMGVTRLAAVCRTLVREGKSPSTPAALVESGTLPNQRTLVATLHDLAEKVSLAGMRPPSLLVVGDVVARRPDLNWFESLPLFGQTIVVTRPQPEANESAQSLEALGAEVILAPMVTIEDLSDYADVDRAITNLANYDWLVFTSVNGVRSFIDRILTIGSDLRALGRIKLAAIGPATSEALASYHLKADLMATSYRSEGLVEAMSERVRGQRLLLARADRSRAILNDELAKIATVMPLTVYRNVDALTLPEGLADRIVRDDIDWITLTSSAITERMYELLPIEARNLIGSKVKLASLSPLTTATAHRLGWDVAVEATQASWEALVEAITSQVRPPS